MKTPTQFRQGQTGFSITELMVAVTIALIVLAAVAAMFVNANKAYTNRERTSRVQENGRFAMYYLLRDLRMSGYMGCQKDLTDRLTNDLNTTTGFAFGTTAIATPVEGIDDVTSSSTPAWSPSGSTTLPTNIWNNTATAIAKPDLITIRMVDSSSKNQLTAAMTSYTDNITINPINYTNHPVVLVADCMHADLVQVSGTNSTQLLHATTCPSGVTPCNSTAQLYKQYDTSASVMPFVTRTYFIGLNNNVVPTLYRQDNGGTPVELVEGIESMKILYGITNCSGNPSSYCYRKASAMSATDWTNVVSVKIGILARTTNTKDTDIDNNTYNVNSTSIGPFNDRNSRRVFTATAQLKNPIVP